MMINIWTYYFVHDEKLEVTLEKTKLFSKLVQLLSNTNFLAFTAAALIANTSANQSF